MQALENQELASLYNFQLPPSPFSVLKGSEIPRGIDPLGMTNEKEILPWNDDHNVITSLLFIIQNPLFIIPNLLFIIPNLRFVIPSLLYFVIPSLPEAGEESPLFSLFQRFLGYDATL
ncbi:hypothetical protein V4D30_01385 [Thermodesulfovibrio sp. 3907-1M]|uniref:Uncharacterized protein n=1 Tax=Thermodesulfovibrio autotrophicus TaxID=3118333 RepID=A0AAU8GWZ4_9BACT